MVTGTFVNFTQQPLLACLSLGHHPAAAVTVTHCLVSAGESGYCPRVTGKRLKPGAGLLAGVPADGSLGAGSPSRRSDLRVTSRVPGTPQPSSPPRDFLGRDGDKLHEVAFLTDLLLADHIHGSGSGQRGGQVCGPELAGRRRGRRICPGGPAGLALVQTKTQAPRQRGPLGQHRDPGEHHVSRASGRWWKVISLL